MCSIYKVVFFSVTWYVRNRDVSAESLTPAVSLSLGYFLWFLLQACRHSMPPRLLSDDIPGWAVAFVTLPTGQTSVHLLVSDLDELFHLSCASWIWKHNSILFCNSIWGFLYGEVIYLIFIYMTCMFTFLLYFISCFISGILYIMFWLYWLFFFL